MKEIIYRYFTVEWFFCCDYDGEKSYFDGVSLIDFDSEGKIASVKEFKSDCRHTYPFSDI